MRCVSLFSGCGGLDLGLSRAGFTAALAVDSEPLCAASYRANFPDAAFFTGPVADVPPALLKPLAGVDLLAGGPPCPPYSKSRFYRTTKPRALADAVGQETLDGYLDVLRRVRPRAFLIENVAGMAYRVHQDALKLIDRTAEELGYTTAWRVLNAANYGVPQLRERFILVGLRGRRFRFPEPTHGRPAGASLFDELPPWRTAGDALDDLDTEENADHAGHFAGGKYHDALTKVPPGENYLHFTAERGHPAPLFRWRSRYWSFLLKLSRELPSWTIQARRSNNMGPFHWRNRILRVAEVKRLQTIPDGWHLAGTVEKQWRQVGNAVPPLLAERLGAALREQIR